MTNLEALIGMGELSFDGTVNGYISQDGLEESILLGTFSKTVTPGMRLGFMIINFCLAIT